MDLERKISVNRTIAIAPSKIFDVLSNPYLHAVIDGSETVKGDVKGPNLLKLGDKFNTKMRTWNIPYRITNTVVEYEENCLIAWAHFGKHRWRYELDAATDGTIVTETFDWGESLWPRMIELAGYPTKHPPHMGKTLERLEAYLMQP